MDEALAEPPYIAWYRLPQPEQDAGRLVRDGLEQLAGYVRDFAAALSLFDFSTEQSRFLIEQGIQRPLNEREKTFLAVSSSWPFVPARDGAMTIYHFGITLEGIRRSLGLCPSLGKFVDHQAFRSCQRAFREKFPAAVKLRDAVAHAADKLASPNKYAEHAFRGGYEGPAIDAANPPGGVTITNGLEGRIFTNTWEGQIYAYEISQRSLQDLDLIRVAAWEAFKRAPHPRDGLAGVNPFAAD